MDIVGKVKIRKDDRGIYKTKVLHKKSDGEKEYMDTYVNFAGDSKGTDIKNQTIINIIEGFLSFFKIECKDSKAKIKQDDGSFKEGTAYVKKNFPTLVIRKFEILEDGIDEVDHHKEYSENNQNQVSKDEIQAPQIESFDIYDSNQELPF